MSAAKVCPVCGKRYTGRARDIRCFAGFEESMGGDTVILYDCDGTEIALDAREVLLLRKRLIGKAKAAIVERGR